MRDLIFKYIYPLDFRAVTAAVAVILPLWALALGAAAEKVRKGLNAVLCIAAVFAILELTILSRQPSVSVFSPIPFYSLAAARNYPLLYRDNFMNVLLFVPFGMALPYILPDRCKHKIRLTALCGLSFSVIIELSQLIFKLGKCETDDLIMNTLGTLIGSLAFVITCVIDKKKRG